MSKQYITIVGSAWCNERGHGISYSWDRSKFDTRKEAIDNGFSIRDSDDFNVGVVEGGALVSLDWMDEVIASEYPEELADIAAEIGFKG